MSVRMIGVQRRPSTCLTPLPGMKGNRVGNAQVLAAATTCLVTTARLLLVAEQAVTYPLV